MKDDKTEDLNKQLKEWLREAEQGSQEAQG